MGRDIFGNRKVNKEDMYTKQKVTSADVRMEYVKMVLWLILGYAQTAFKTWSVKKSLPIQLCLTHRFFFALRL